MSLVRSKNTKPEMFVRRLVHALGYRYRLHVAALPGSPDLVFPSRRAVIFVHGCFWHRHKCDAGNRTPRSRLVFWRRKLEGNRRRDERNRRALCLTQWRVLVIWECQTKFPDRLSRRVAEFLGE
jgi:DNA mismatch endonuclease (patch repair protein)